MSIITAGYKRQDPNHESADFCDIPCILKWNLLSFFSTDSTTITETNYWSKAIQYFISEHPQMPLATCDSLSLGSEGCIIRDQRKECIFWDQRGEQRWIQLWIIDSFPNALMTVPLNSQNFLLHSHFLNIIEFVRWFYERRVVFVEVSWDCVRDPQMSR